MAVVGHAQQAPPDPASLTEAQKASLKHLKELLAVVNTGDHAAIVSYFKANTVQRSYPVPAGVEPRTVEQMVIRAGLNVYRISRGYDLVRVTTDSARHPDVVVGIVRNRLTGDEEVLMAHVEPEAPHRITGIRFGTMALSPEVRATLGLQRAVSVAVTEKDRLQEIGSYLKRMGDADSFSGAVVIARDGKPVFAQAYGYADREKKIANTVDTPFLLASMTKPFTGLAIGQLVEQGKLSYDDPLSKFLPEYPDPESAKKITIKHLLSHTSGLGADIFGPALEQSLDKATSVQGYIDVAERKPPAFEPGTKWEYNSLGFVLLGRIVEIVSGQDYYDYMQKNVFAPAGAKSASFPLLPANGVAVVPMAYPYESDFDFKNLRFGFLNYLGKQFRRGSPAGSSVVSALDLLKLSNAMNAGRIVKPETLRLHTSAKPELGATGYGYGFFPTKYGRPFVGHGGNAQGQCTEFGELKDTPYTIVVLSNVTINTCIDVTARILRVLRPSAAPAAHAFEENGGGVGASRHHGTLDHRQGHRQGDLLALLITTR
jgi:CubicO group peptidase (beta-lactamase class C family)